jgi:hypothetical protein
MFSLDELDPTAFEEFCYDLLTALGFVNVSWRKGTGLKSSPSDFGRDIECQYKRVDIDGKVRLEKWFVECKHYKKGVPPSELSAALAWAESENVDTLLIIASNFLSNPAKEYLETYKRERKPRFVIKVWEKPDLENLVAGKSLLLRKYKLTGDFPFLTIIHPAHALYMSQIPINTLDYLFETLDTVEPEERDSILSWISIALIKTSVTGYQTHTVFGKTVTLAEHDRSRLTYEAFKKECYKLAEVLDEPLLVFLIINWVLQCQLRIGDITAIDEFIKRQQQSLEFMKGEFREKHVFTDEDRKGVEVLEKRLQESIDTAQENIHKQYSAYVGFCENVVVPLLKEKYFQQ